MRALVRIINQAEDRAAPKAQQFEIFKGEDLKTYFRLRAGNGEIMLSSQGYTASSSAKKGIESVKTNGVDASRYEVFETDAGQYALRLVAANGEVIARGESYASKSNADRAVARLAEILSARTLRTAE